MTGRLSAALGALLGVVGLVALVAPGLITGLPANRGLLMVLAAILVIGGLRELQSRRSETRNYAETPDTEEAIELPTPGEDFDHRFDQLSLARYRRGEQERLRKDIREVAVETVARRRGLTTAEARESLRDGNWTDDPFAAALFTSRPPDVSRFEQIREVLRPGLAFKQRAARVADELSRLEAADPDDLEGRNE